MTDELSLQMRLLRCVVIERPADTLCGILINAPRLTATLVNAPTIGRIVRHPTTLNGQNIMLSSTKRHKF